MDLLQAVGEDEVYLLGSSQVWHYKIGEDAAVRKISTKLFGGHMTPDGKFWLLEYASERAEPRQHTASVMEWGKAPQVVYRFKMQGHSSIFWHDPKIGLFLFNYLREKDGSTR